MVKHNQAAVAGMVLSDRHDAVRRGVNRRAVIRRYIDTRMERTLTAERIEPLS